MDKQSLLAQATIDLGQTAIDQGLPGTADVDTSNYAAGFATVLGSLMSFIMVIAALAVLLYLLWGALEWITAGGESGKVEKARTKMMNAIIGIIVLSAVTAIFMLVQQFLGLNLLDFQTVVEQQQSSGG
ncbi:MAG: hypothetical protein WAU07_00990 [Microgenomates group bacterium]